MDLAALQEYSGADFVLLDSKSRVTLPSKLLTILKHNMKVELGRPLDQPFTGEIRVKVTFSPWGKIGILTPGAFERLLEDIAAGPERLKSRKYSPIHDPESLLEDLTMHLQEATLDASGRMTLPPYFIETLKLEKGQDVAVIGRRHLIEIADKQAHLDEVRKTLAERSRRPSASVGPPAPPTTVINVAAVPAAPIAIPTPGPASNTTLT